MFLTRKQWQLKDSSPITKCSAKITCIINNNIREEQYCSQCNLWMMTHSLTGSYRGVKVL